MMEQQSMSLTIQQEELNQKISANEGSLKRYQYTFKQYK